MFGDAEQFFSEIQSEDCSKDVEDIWYICINEFGWTEKELMNTSIPFIWCMLAARKRRIELERKAYNITK